MVGGRPRRSGAAIIRYYDAIMTLITIIAIIALFTVVEVSMK
jgi:hypothetical protein